MRGLPDRFWDPPKLSIQRVRGSASRGIERPADEADQSPSSGAEVKNAWI